MKNKSHFLLIFCCLLHCDKISYSMDQLKFSKMNSFYIDVH